MKTKEAVRLAAKHEPQPPGAKPGFPIGGVQKLSLLLGMSRSAVSMWGENVPALREYQLREKRPEWFAKRSRSINLVEGEKS